MNLAKSDLDRPRDVRRALIEAGRALLNEEGADGLSLRATSRRAGVSPGAPYKHFADKKALLEAIADEGFDELCAETGSAFDRYASGPERIRALCLIYVEFALRNPLLYGVMMSATRSRELVNDGGRGQAEVVRLMRLSIASASGLTIDDRAVELRALAVWFALHGLIELHSFRAVQTMRTASENLHDFLDEIIAQIVG
ncbi:TetR/AcrR family transcriptional regulator [Novosphingobium flavum]|uniref:TetR/AcrR family transcriptional regulator n=1 Tax=Novosphingobium flavum TaxID=1778672 RepID=A0A7X1FUF3_9SPHN|nr:TetR/AcrR family transcriptional regulator [Novosphingobium flavum]MBC2667193.1 TetR/AcrR family transcriptional regulator [Novosphingobium flavum]